MILDEKYFTKNQFYYTNKNPIKNISQYLVTVNLIQKGWNIEELWYRGVSNIDFDLVPSIYRESTWKYDSDKAYDLFHNFIRQAKPLTNLGFNYSLWDWYLIQQHYGLPTRLLDWTDGHLIALFFAVRNLDNRSSPCIWILEPFQLNEIAIGQRNVFFTDELIMDDNDKHVNKYLYDNKELPPLPIAITPSHIDNRIKSQKSAFTIHGSLKNGFEQSYLSNEKDFKLCKIIVKPSQVYSIKAELDYAGISESTLFPDLEGLTRQLKYYYGMK